nr:hypothetical protein [Tanacetum cinerariifolium]
MLRSKLDPSIEEALMSLLPCCGLASYKVDVYEEQNCLWAEAAGGSCSSLTVNPTMIVTVSQLASYGQI